MSFWTRELSEELRSASRVFSAVVITGPRRSGKTTLVRRTYPRACYRLLEDPDVLARVRTDPKGFLEELRPPVILDEIQNAPELFGYVRSRIDASPRRKGQWFLTGSQESSLMHDVTESMAGRAAILQLLPLSIRESPRVSQLLGGYPEVVAHPRSRNVWFRSYVQTYLERDVRQLLAVRDLSTFRRFMSLLATRSGCILNKTDLAAPLSVSVPTISQWLNVLETTGVLLLVPPYFENLGKRIIKSPKVFFVDSGLACHLLGIESEQQLEKSTFRGAIFEGFVCAEICKTQINAGRRREVYYFRDQQGLEVDLLVPEGPGRITLVEIKASKTVHPSMADPMIRLRSSMPPMGDRNFVVHLRSKSDVDPVRVVRPGVTALTVEEVLRELSAPKRRRVR